MTTSPAPAGIDYPGVSRFFAQHIPGGDAPLAITLISGGRSNLTYKVSSPGRDWVLRRPPLGHVLPTAHDMAREFKVLDGLAKTDVPVPHPVALCEDNSFNGAPFYVMDLCEGVIIVDALPEGYATTEAERRALGLGMIRTMARLHAVDYNAVGLADFGRPEGYIARQVRRWHEQWQRSETRPIPEIDEVIRRLNNAIPESPAPTIVHGDFRLGNLMMAADEPGRVVAILDWEMATLGDPLADVGYTLLYWTEMGDDPGSVAGSLVTAQPGFCSRAELGEEYARLSGRNVRDVDFYRVMAAYKLAVIVEGIHARFLKGQTVGEGFENYGERVVQLVHLALDMTNKSSNPRLRGE